MNEPNLTPQTPTQTTPLRCITGALFSGALAYAAYSLTSAIATTYATKPIHSHNWIVLNITSAVRTLVVGVTAFASAVFAIATVGLVALAVQLLFQQLIKR